MSSDFPTYGRGDDPAEPEPLSQYGGYAKPTAYGPGGYSQPRDPNRPPQQGPPQGPRQPYGQPQFGQPPYAPPGHPQQPPYGFEAVGPQVMWTERNPRIARLVLITTIVTAVYGFLVLTIQRVSLRDIAQAPGSPLNHPLRTDLIDTLGQVSVTVLGAVSIGFWLRDLMIRRRAGQQPDPIELGGLGLVGIALVPLMVWFLMVLSTGMGAVDEAVDRLPTAYGWGGLGLLMLAGGFAVGYRSVRPVGPRPIVQPPPQRPPWA